jgi:hypothetical protein
MVIQLTPADRRRILQEALASGERDSTGFFVCNWLSERLSLEEAALSKLFPEFFAVRPDKEDIIPWNQESKGWFGSTLDSANHEHRLTALALAITLTQDSHTTTSLEI